MQQKEVLTITEAAELLGLSSGVIREQAKWGALPARKIGREWRFSRQVLLRWLQGTPTDRPTVPFREYSDDEIAGFLQADKLDPETARRVERLLRK